MSQEPNQKGEEISKPLSARTKIRELQINQKKDWKGINALSTGRPRLATQDLPDEEIDADFRSQLLLKLIRKI